MRQKKRKILKKISIGKQLDIFGDAKKYKKRRKGTKINPQQLKYILLHKKKIIIGGLITTLLGSLYMLFFSSFFTLKEIYIYRNDSLSNIEIAYGNMNYFRGKNIFFIESENIVSRLQNSQKSLKYIQIDKKFPRTLEITLESYTPLFAYSDQEMILKNGTILPINPSTQATQLPLIEIRSSHRDTDVLDFKHLAAIDYTIKSLRKNILSLSVERSLYYEQEEELLIVLEIGGILIFDLQKNIENQVQKLAIFHEEKSNILTEDFIYIDLRIDGKIFTCETENTQVCQNNLKNIYDFERSDLEITQTKDL